MNIWDNRPGDHSFQLEISLMQKFLPLLTIELLDLARNKELNKSSIHQEHTKQYCI